MELKQKITNLLTTNKISTTEVCDVMGKVGNLEGILPVNQGLYAAGEVFYSFAHDETNFDLHRQLEKIEKNQIAFIDSIDCGNRAVIGDLVAKYLLLYKGAKGVVTNGYMRDANELIKQRNLSPTVKIGDSAKLNVLFLWKSTTTRSPCLRNSSKWIRVKRISGSSRQMLT